MLFSFHFASEAFIFSSPQKGLEQMSMISCSEQKCYFTVTFLTNFNWNKTDKAKRRIKEQVDIFPFYWPIKISVRGWSGRYFFIGHSAGTINPLDYLHCFYFCFITGIFLRKKEMKIYCPHSVLCRDDDFGFVTRVNWFMVGYPLVDLFTFAKITKLLNLFLSIL